MCQECLLNVGFVLAVEPRPSLSPSVSLALPPLSVLVAHLHRVSTPSLFSSHPALIQPSRISPPSSSVPLQTSFVWPLSTDPLNPVATAALCMCVCACACVCMCVCVRVLMSLTVLPTKSSTVQLSTETTQAGTLVQ